MRAVNRLRSPEASFGHLKLSTDGAEPNPPWAQERSHHWVSPQSRLRADWLLLMKRSRARLAVILLLAALAALALLATNIVLPVMPEMMGDVGAPVSAASLVLGVFLSVFAVGQLIAGPLSDTFGRRPVLLLGLAIFALGSLVASQASDLSVLLAGRALQGLGAASTSALSRAVLRDLFEGQELARALGWVMAIMSAAPGFSPLIGALIGEAFGWRAILVSLVVAAVVLGLAYEIIAGESLLPECRAPQRIVHLGHSYLSLLKNATFVRPAGSNALTMGALLSYFSASPEILRNTFNVGPMGIGIFFATTVLAVFAASGRAPLWSHRMGHAGVIRLGLAICTIGAAVAFTTVLPRAIGLGVYVAASMFFLFGVGLILPVTTALTIGPFASKAGQASALLGFLQMGAAAVSLLILPAIPASPAVSLALIMVGYAAAARLAVRPIGRPLAAAA